MTPDQFTINRLEAAERLLYAISSMLQNDILPCITSALDQLEPDRHQEKEPKPSNRAHLRLISTQQPLKGACL